MGPLGVFVVSRRIAYFGDALAHSALLGVALRFLTRINASLAVIGVCFVLALILVALRRGRGLADDTLLGILSHIALSLGLVAIAFLETLRVDLVSYSVWRHSRSFLGRHHLDLRWRRTGAGRVNCFLWRDLIALAMKVVGILLVTSLLIIPAATARRFARSPDQMAALAAVVGAIAVVAGLAGALHWDLLSAPTIVAAALCALASVLPGRLHGARSVD